MRTIERWGFILIGIAFALGAMLIMTGCAQAQEVDMSIISEIESSHDVKAFNRHSQARGLCQITPVVLKEFNTRYGTRYGLSKLFDGEFNLMVADWYMNTRIPEMLKAYHIKDSLMSRIWAYNAGVGNLKKGFLPSETKDYIRKYKQIQKRDER